MPAADNVYPFPDLSARALRGAQKYQAGVAKAEAGIAEAIDGIFEVGLALLEMRRDGDKLRHNVTFKKMVEESGITKIKPFDLRPERSCAMQLAEVIRSNATTDNFRACPYTTPTNIMKWYRLQTSATAQEGTQTPKVKATPQTDAAYEALLQARAEGRKVTKRQLAEEAGVSHMTAEKALDRSDQEQKVGAEIKKNEDAALTEAEVTFSAKSKLTLAKAISIHKARLDKAFEETVNTEVRRRIAEANDSVRARLKEADKQILMFERERGRHGVFSEVQYKQMLMLCHPDNSASDETRSTLLNILTRHKVNLVNPAIR